MRVVQERTRGIECFGIALLLKGRPELLIALGLLAAELLDRRLRIFFEAWLATVDVIEAPRQLARQFDVRDLVLAHRHHVRAIDQDVSALHHRIAKKPVVR